MIERPCMPGQVCGDAPQCDVRPGLRRPSAGTSYRGQLFEHFRIGLSGKSWCGLKTVLQIDWLEGRDRFNYDLIESRGRETLGGSALCGVSVDEGFAELTQKGEAIEFQGEKTIQFRANPPDDFDRWLNASAPASLCVMGALVAGGLCCDAP